ncbi:MAG: lipid-A-disaccharide synthase [Candidatus Margulisbacteria bacterium]|nr:lipid-A-disaccharide synthase [Candidatus Margulisiibacteriota bacterium]
MNKRIMVSAIEVSADFHLANLIKVIKEKDSEIEYFGLAGHNCAEIGVKVTADLTTKSTIGFIEPLKHIPSFLYHLFKAKLLLEKEKPDLLIVVDGQGFNMPLAAHAKKLNIPVIYYIPPQEWQWGTEKGGKKVLEVTDKIITLFKDAADFYNKLGGKAYWNGHALIDIVQPKLNKEEFFEKNNLDLKKPLLGIFPGSRRQELKYLLPVLVKMTKLIKKEKTEMQFVISAATPYCYKKISKIKLDFPVLSNLNYDIMAHSDLVVTSTGTSTLELACLLKPMIAIYKFSPLSYLLIKKLVGHRVPKYAALPNIWLDKMAIPEFVQQGVEPQSLADDVIKLFKNSHLLEEMKNELKKLDKVLGQKGALEKNAGIVLSTLRK